MLDIVRFDHISVAVQQLEPQIELLQRLFGFRYAGRFDEEGMLGATLEVPGTSGVAWEVIAPSGPESHIQRFLDGPRGAGFHHLAIQVRDLDAAVAEMRAEGIEPWGLPGAPHAGDGGEADGAPSVPPAFEPPGPDGQARGVVYIHPRQGGYGCLYQLYAGDPWHVGRGFDDDGEHTLGIIAVNHVAHAHHDHIELAEWYRRLFGMTLLHVSPDDEPAPGGFRTAVLEASTRQLRFEMLTPSQPDSFVQRFIDRRGPAMHHVAFEVEDWDRAIAACAQHGVGTFGERAGETQGVPWREAFIYPRDTGGMLVQFFWQAEPGVWI